MSHLHFIRISAVHITSSVPFYISFLSGVKNAINWPALHVHVLVFMAQLVECCSVNAEAMSLNPVEAPKILFLGLCRNCLNCKYNRDGHIFISF